MIRVLFALAVFWSIALASAAHADLSPIPDKLVVLTFDDGNVSDYTFVAPLLKQFDFGATFYVTSDSDWLGIPDRDDWRLSWAQARELEKDGFEIGNHSFTHANIVPLSRAEATQEIAGCERTFQKQGLAKPTTFAYPGATYNLTSMDLLKEHDYQFARRGHFPEHANLGYGGRGPAYDPRKHHPLLVPTTLMPGPGVGWEDFVWAVDQARNGNICVLTLHGVPDAYPHCTVTPDRFRQLLHYLRDQSCTVIALRDLAKYVDPGAFPKDKDPYEAIFAGLVVSPVRLTCEYADNPLGIDSPQPRFSWLLTSTRRDQLQSAYQILAASSREKLDQDTGDLWDSGRVASDSSVNIPYQGAPLASGQRVWWKVRCWNKPGDDGQWVGPQYYDEPNVRAMEGELPSHYSPLATFEMGLLSENDWEGQWIGADPSVSSPLVRKEFIVSKKIARARVYVSGLGWSELYINGQKVSNRVLDPAMTDYNKRVLYVTHDVTARFSQGANAVGVMLGNGFFSEPPAEHPGFKRVFTKYGESPTTLLQLNIEYEDGTTQSIVSDSSWRTAPGPIVLNAIYDGETYDARKEQPDWSRPGFDETAWKQAELKKAPQGILVSQVMPPVVVQQTLQPARMTIPKPGVYVYDLGVVRGGWVRVRLKGTEGTKVTIRYSHWLHEDGTVHGDGAGRQADIYILKGDPHGEVYETRFAYHPLRYLEISGSPVTPQIVDVVGQTIHSDFDYSGNFECSNTLLNRIHDNVLWTYKNEMIGIPVDDLHAEHWGWLDPGAVASALYTRKYNPSFWKKWLDDCKDSQREDGSVPDVVPNYHPHHWESFPGDPAWAGNYPILVWYFHQYYGDDRVLSEHYDSIKNFVDFLVSTADGYTLTQGRYGEHMLPGRFEGDPEKWVNTEEPIGPLVWTGYYYRTVSILAEAARLLGKSEDASDYAALAENIKDAFNKKWLNTDANMYTDPTVRGFQTCNFLPLALGIVPEQHREGVLKNVVKDIVEERDGYLQTGNTGTTCLVDTLAGAGYGDVMYNLTNRISYPGWGWSTAQGATSSWESWSGARASMMLINPINEFFYNDLAGIQGPDYHGPGYQTPGFAKINIKPYPLGDLTHTSASVRTVRGIIASNWMRTDNTFDLEVEIPVNSQAKVSIPKLGNRNVTVSESATSVWDENAFVGGNPGVTGGSEDDAYVTFDVGSGKYRFQLSAGD